MADVLVVDPGELGELLATLFNQYGIRAFHARTGESALEMAMHDVPSICVIDFELPDASGLDLADLLRAELETKVVFTYSQAHAATPPFEGFNERVAALDASFARPFRSLTLIEATARILGKEMQLKTGDVTRPPTMLPSTGEDELDFKIDITSPENEVASAGSILDLDDEVSGAQEAAKPLDEVIRPAHVLAPEDLAALWVRLQDAPRPVEREPAPPVMESEGPLTPRKLAELLDAFHQSQTPGQIWLSKDDARRVLLVQRGLLVGARSNVAGENVWALAGKRGAIAEDLLRDLRTLVEAGKARSFADAVIKSRALQGMQLRQLIDEHVRRIALRAFTWHGGTYRVALNERLAGDGYAASVTIADAIVRGIVLTESIEGLRKAAPDAARFAPAPDTAYGLDQLALTADEARVVVAMDGTKTIQDLATLFDGVPERTLRGLAAGLLCIGLVRFAGFGPAAARRIAFF